MTTGDKSKITPDSKPGSATRHQQLSPAAEDFSSSGGLSCPVRSLQLRCEPICRNNKWKHHISMAHNKSLTWLRVFRSSAKVVGALCSYDSGHRPCTLWRRFKTSSMTRTRTHCPSSTELRHVGHDGDCFNQACLNRTKQWIRCQDLLSVLSSTWGKGIRLEMLVMIIPYFNFCSGNDHSLKQKVRV